MLLNKEADRACLHSTLEMLPCLKNVQKLFNSIYWAHF